MQDRALRKQLVTLLQGGEAHAPVEETVRSFNAAHAGSRIEPIRNTPWRLIEHLRIAQWDILEFSRNPQHVSPKFPSGYWPQSDAPANGASWQTAVESFCADLRAMQALVANQNTDLFAPIPHGEGQTILRQALLVVDHNAYHMGQLVALQRALES